MLFCIKIMISDTRSVCSGKKLSTLGKGKVLNFLSLHWIIQWIHYICVAVRNK